MYENIIRQLYHIYSNIVKNYLFYFRDLFDDFCNVTSYILYLDKLVNGY